MRDYDYINWEKCVFCDNQLEDTDLLTHSVVDCPAFENDE